MTRQALALLEQGLSGPAKNAADLLPKPLKLAKQLGSSDVISVIRKSRDSKKHG